MIASSKQYAVAHEVAEAHGFTLEEIRSKHRGQTICAARRAVAHALRKAGASYLEAGLIMNRDHTNVMYLVKTGVSENVRTEAEPELQSSIRATG